MRLRSLSALNRSRPLEIALTTLPDEILMTVYARAKAIAIHELVRSVHGDSFEWYGYTVAEKG